MIKSLAIVFLFLMLSCTKKDVSDLTANGKYTYSNNDAVGVILTNGSPFQDTIVNTYDLNHLAVNGNMDEFNQLLKRGVYTIKNKHLLIRSEDYVSPINYSYKFNTEGDISSVTFTLQAYTTNISYTYGCK